MALFRRAKWTECDVDHFKGKNIPCGWSAAAGQSQSAYVRGGLDPRDSTGGRSVGRLNAWNVRPAKSETESSRFFIRVRNCFQRRPAPNSCRHRDRRLARLSLHKSFTVHGKTNAWNSFYSKCHSD